MAQFGFHRDPVVIGAWQNQRLFDDPPKQPNVRGTISFAATPSPHSRSTQLFINLGSNARLDKMGFAPLCKVSEGMAVAEKFFDGHGGKVSAKQGDIQREGNAYLRREWPGLDYITSAAVLNEK